MDTRIHSRSWILLALLSLLMLTEVKAKEPLQTIRFQSLDFFPEGFDWDAKHDRFLLGSTISGALLSVSADGSIEEFVRDEDYAAKAAVLGVTIDRKYNRVIAAVQSLESSDFSGVAAYDLDTKKRLYFTRLDRVGVNEGDKSCSSDVAVDNVGNAYVTNCRSNFVWKVTQDGTPSVFVQHVNLTTQPIIVDSSVSWCGLNGIVYHENGYLLLSQTNSGALFRIDLEDVSIHAVIMKEKLPEADGIALRQDGTLVVVSKEKVWLLGSASNWMAANVVDTVSLNSSDFVTAVAAKERATYILPSYLSELMEGLSRKTFEVREIAFPAEATEDDPMWLIVVLVLVVVLITLWRFQMGHFYKEYRRKRA